MDPTTLLVAVLVAIGLLGTDAVVETHSVVVEVVPPPKSDSVAITKSTLEQTFDYRLNQIAQTISLVRPFEIRAASQPGIGMALADAAGVRGVAYALQGEIGFHPDRLRFALYTEDGRMRALVSGQSHASETFHTVMVPAKDETVLAFTQRCALWGASQLAPYSTTLYLLNQHASDQDFTDVIALAEHTKAMLPPTPRSLDRSLMDNVLGLVALFKNDRQGARDAFEAALREDPDNPVPFLNAAFTDLQFDENKRAADRMEQLIRVSPPSNEVLLATAYMTWGAALMGLKDFKAADQMLAKAIEINPSSATALELWSEERELQGDKASSQRLYREALAESATFENYAEVAALYFHLAWENNLPVTRSRFTNPATVTLH
jgi:tetratricopeptide (TPR) repeat protein